MATTTQPAPDAEACPRGGCPNTLSAGQILCTADVHALAGMCRGKKRLGQPEAELIAHREPGRPAYSCPLCRMWHNGTSARRQTELIAVAQATVRALRQDPRVGWRGVLQLADAWAPAVVPRSRWAIGIDQQVAIAAC